ncbi:37S ribosomal protein S17 mitochondrial [Chamberlinius hualienensis]
MATKRAVLLIGRCLRASREEGVEVVVTNREIDTYLNMYFPEKYTFFAYDEKEIAKPSDLIIIKKRETPLTRKITHDVVKVVYPFGDITDPVTGKKVVAGKFRETMHDIDRTFMNEDSNGFTSYLDKQRELEKLGPAPPPPPPRFLRRRQRKVENKPEDSDK